MGESGWMAAVADCGLFSCEQNRPGAGRTGTLLEANIVGLSSYQKSRVMRYSRVWLIVLLLLIVQRTSAFAQQEDPSAPAAPAADPAPIDPDALPVNLERIQKAVSRPAAIKTESTRPVFRVQVFSRSPTIDDILGPDWRKGPTPLGAMTHQEFLDIVTPNDVKGYAAFDNKQALVVAATSFALKWAVQKALDKLDQARTDRQKEAARKEVDEALAALRKARRDAGLPDK
jgi:hypothetical protein